METIFNSTVSAMIYVMCGMIIGLVIINIIQARNEHKRNQDILDRYINDLKDD